MKNVLAWIKGHVLIVVFSAVILIVLPACFVLSMMWGNSIRDAQSKAADGEMKKVTSARVSYALPPAGPGLQPVSLSAPANDELTKWFKERKDRMDSQSKEILVRAEAFNKRDHKPLMDGVFPAPADRNDEARLSIEFIEKLVGRGPYPAVYTMLAQRARAGMPPEVRRVADSLRQIEENEVQRIKGNNAQAQLNDQQKADIAKRMLEQRLGLYQARAREISVYMTPEAVLNRDGMAAFPTRLPPQPPPLYIAFTWNWDFWAVSDVLDAIASVNKTSGGSPTSVPESVVKHIERLTFDSLLKDDDVPEGPIKATTAAPVDGSQAAIEPDFMASPTGRSKKNTIYDLRPATLVVVVSSSRLPELLDALARTNFISVLDLDLEEVDVWRDLERGFYYGDDHVVRAKLRLETLWLRSWTAPLMPKPIRDHLGIPDPAPAASTAPAANPAANPAPANNPPAPKTPKK